MDSTSILITVGALAVIVKGVVAWARRNYPSLDGNKVQGIAIAVGIAIAAALDLRGTAALLESIGAGTGRVPHFVIDYIITGIAIAFTSGVLAEAVGISGPSAEPVVVEVDVEGTPV
jgi:hypothetical protein